MHHHPLGSAQQFIEQIEWSLHSAIRMAIKNDSMVAGSRAFGMEFPKYLRDCSRTIPGKKQLLIRAHAKALEIIPCQLCDNAGFDAANTLHNLQARHAQRGMRYGVDVHNEDFAHNSEAFVRDPAMVRIHALTAASEAACLVRASSLHGRCTHSCRLGLRSWPPPIERHLSFP